MDNFLSRPCVASDFAHDDDMKRNRCVDINQNDNDDDSLILSSWQCEKKIHHEDKRVDSTLAFFAATQHTLSTFCSTERDDDDDDDDLSGCWNDDDISLGSFNDGYQFDCQPPLGVENNVDSAEQNPMGNVINNACMAQPMVITFNNNTITENIQGNPNEQIHGDLFTSFHNSQESMFRGVSRACRFQPHDMLVGPHAKCLPNQGLNDSMTSLSEAFEKLDYCMLRTAQSRKLVRQMTEKMGLSTPSTLPCTTVSTSSTATFLATSTTSAAAISTSTACSTILRSNSLSSLNGSGSVSSKSHRKKGPKSFHKTRRQVNKATLSNTTGVALRTLLNASFS